MKALSALYLDGGKQKQLFIQNNSISIDLGAKKFWESDTTSRNKTLHLSDFTADECLSGGRMQGLLTVVDKSDLTEIRVMVLYGGDAVGPRLSDVERLFNTKFILPALYLRNPGESNYYVRANRAAEHAEAVLTIGLDGQSNLLKSIELRLEKSHAHA